MKEKGASHRLTILKLLSFFGSTKGGVKNGLSATARREGKERQSKTTRPARGEMEEAML